MAPDEAVNGQRSDVLDVAVLRVMEVSRPRSGNRRELQELSDALTQNSVPHSAPELSKTLGRLEDCGHVKRTQRQPGFNLYPLFYVRGRARPYDRFDASAVDVCEVLRHHGERFDDDERLKSWLGEAGVRYTSEDLAMALGHLERLGRIGRPRRDHWGNRPLPGWYVEPKIYPE